MVDGNEPEYDERVEMGDVKNSDARLWGTWQYDPYYRQRVAANERAEAALDADGEVLRLRRLDG